MQNPETITTPTELTVVPRDITMDQLMERLIKGGVPIDEYGIGNAKTLAHLLSEVNEGETVMTVGADGKVYRELNVLWVDVICEHSDGNIYILKEDHQEFNDEHKRIKRRSLDSSLGEKLKPGETPEEGALRAILEEIGVENIATLHAIGYNERTFTPDTFPGIESTYKMHQYVSTIPESEFRPDGYIEFQADKTNFYLWQILERQ